MIKSTLIDAATKDYVVRKGSFIYMNELLTEAYSRIVCPIGTYYFDQTFGSYIPSWINSRKKVTPNIISNEITRALSVLISEKRAKGISIKINSILFNGFSVDINITDADNASWVLPINYFNYQRGSYGEV